MNSTEEYKDIINMPYKKSQKHSHMPLRDRAAQFAPFAALSGYDAAISEAARLTDRRLELDDESAAALNSRISALSEAIEKRPLVEITYFEPDVRKQGGAYLSFRANARVVDLVLRVIKFTDGREIPLDDIISLELVTAF